VLASCVPPLPLTLNEEAADQPHCGFVRALHDRSRAVTSSRATTQRLEQHRRARREEFLTGEDGYEDEAFTSATTFFSTAGVHSVSAYDVGHMGPSSSMAASSNPSVA